MAQTLERHCLKRFEGESAGVHKEDLRILMDDLYFDPASIKDCQDAALLALMWHAFGRASYLGFVAKSNLKISADGVRVNTSKEQGISIFPDQVSFVTCPLCAIVMALVISHLLDNPQFVTGDEERTVIPIDIFLAEALAACDGDNTERPPRLQASHA
ncbi:hypothetical protein PHMEG_0006778 [Phytophthora megakarya]|uniref:Uncharacterized protein n=1 Tax=Phytophthora megakarya TaxID=4795 RepID=A0A225WN40_9STRA|nr:hypothetical protein PHMEG_0006778 [Phytophthora megakarya]